MGRLEVQDLSHSYGRTIRALQGLSLTLRPGVTGVVGVNGAGKTTFIRVVSGGLRPTSGHVRVAGHDLYGLTMPWQLVTGPRSTPCWYGDRCSGGLPVAWKLGAPGGGDHHVPVPEGLFLGGLPRAVGH